MKSTRKAAHLHDNGDSRDREPARHEDTGYPMTPQQYYDAVNRRHALDAEPRLFFAVLEDAIRCYAMAANSHSAARRREFEEARQWVETRGDYDVFSFDSICRIFEIEPENLRRQLKTLRSSDLPRRQLRTVGRKTPMTVPD
jgi:HD superfamily phosphodiesterase